MSFCNHGRFREQVRFLRRQFLQDGDLPFTDVLSEGAVAHALAALSIFHLGDSAFRISRSASCQS